MSQVCHSTIQFPSRFCVVSNSVSYRTVVVGHGNHAALEIPDAVLKALGANKRAPLKITINGYTYQSTATGVDGKCMVVFPQKDRQGANAKAGDEIEVTLELDTGVRVVDVPEELATALESTNLIDTFNAMTYSKRKEFARHVSEAKTDETRDRRIKMVLSALS